MLEKMDSSPCGRSGTALTTFERSQKPSLSSCCYHGLTENISNSTKMGAAESRPGTPTQEEMLPSYMDPTSPIPASDPLWQTSTSDEDTQRTCDPIVCGGMVSGESHVPARERVPSLSGHVPLMGGFSDTPTRMSPTQQVSPSHGTGRITKQRGLTRCLMPDPGPLLGFVAKR